MTKPACKCNRQKEICRVGSHWMRFWPRGHNPICQDFSFCTNMGNSPSGFSIYVCFFLFNHPSEGFSSYVWMKTLYGNAIRESCVWRLKCEPKMKWNLSALQSFFCNSFWGQIDEGFTVHYVCILPLIMFVCSMKVYTLMDQDPSMLYIDRVPKWCCVT